MLVLRRLVRFELTWQAKKVGALSYATSLTFHGKVSGDYLEYLSYRLRSRIFLCIYCDHIRLITTTRKGSPSMKVLLIALKSTGLHLRPLKITYADYTSRASVDGLSNPDVPQPFLSPIDFCS